MSVRKSTGADARSEQFVLVGLDGVHPDDSRANRDQEQSDERDGPVPNQNVNGVVLFGDS